METKLSSVEMMVAQLLAEMKDLSSEVKSLDGAVVVILTKMDALSVIVRVSTLTSNRENTMNRATWNMEGSAVHWLQGYRLGVECSSSKLTWEMLQHSLLERYRSNLAKHSYRELSKLMQISSLEKYYEEYMSLLMQVGPLMVQQAIDGFISGLKAYVRRDVDAKDLKTINEALKYEIIYDG